MKHFLRMMTLSILILFALTGNAQSNPHDNHHVKHNMVLFGGSNQFYLSHVVYKSPHNFQVILRVDFVHEVKKTIEGTKIDFPNDQLYLVLNTMDIRELETAKPELSGKLVREDSQGNRVTILENVEVGDYHLIYFGEVPLSLANMNW